MKAIRAVYNPLGKKKWASLQKVWFGWTRKSLSKRDDVFTEPFKNILPRNT